MLTTRRILLITLISALFQPPEKRVIIASPQSDRWIITYVTERQLIPTCQNNHASHGRLYLISHYTCGPYLVWEVAISLQISVSPSLFLLTDVLNQWHPNSFTALFPWAWGFVADAFRVKSLSSRAWPSLTHLGVCPTITHAICTNCSICVWIWNAFPGIWLETIFLP